MIKKDKILYSCLNVKRFLTAFVLTRVRLIKATILNRIKWNRKPSSPEIKNEGAPTPKLSIFPFFFLSFRRRGLV